MRYLLSSIFDPWGYADAATDWSEVSGRSSRSRDSASIAASWMLMSPSWAALVNAAITSGVAAGAPIWPRVRTAASRAYGAGQVAELAQHQRRGRANKRVLIDQACREMVEQLRRRDMLAQRSYGARGSEACLGVAVVQGDADERLDQQHRRSLGDHPQHPRRGRADMRGAVAQPVVNQHQIGRGVAALAAAQRAQRLIAVLPARVAQGAPQLQELAGEGLELALDGDTQPVLARAVQPLAHQRHCL